MTAGFERWGSGSIETQLCISCPRGWGQLWLRRIGDLYKGHTIWHTAFEIPTLVFVGCVRRDVRVALHSPKHRLCLVSGSPIVDVKA